MTGGFPRDKGRLAPKPAALGPLPRPAAFPRLARPAPAAAPSARRVTPSQRFPHVPPGADTISFE